MTSDRVSCSCYCMSASIAHVTCDCSDYKADSGNSWSVTYVECSLHQSLIGKFVQLAKDKKAQKAYKLFLQISEVFVILPFLFKFLMQYSSKCFMETWLMLYCENSNKHYHTSQISCRSLPFSSVFQLIVLLECYIVVGKKLPKTCLELKTWGVLLSLFPSNTLSCQSGVIISA